MQSVFISILFSRAYSQWRLRVALMGYALIVVLGALPGARHSVAQIASAGFLHAAAYASLSFFCFTGLSGTLSQRATLTLVIVAVMGALDEGIQYFLPYRVASVGDWIIDIAAAIAAVCLLIPITRKIECKT